MDANLIAETSEDRYRLHDLVRDHPNDLIEQHDQVGDRNIALRRMIGWYLHATADADLALNSFAPRFGPVFDYLTTSTFRTPTKAMAWFESERATILGCQQLAAERGWDDLVYQLAEAMWNPLRPNYTADELRDSQQLGADAARRCEHVLEAVCLMRVAFAESNRGQHAAAIASATAAFDRATAMGHRWTQSAALSTRSRAHLAGDDPHAALEDVTRSLEIEETLDRPARGIALRYRHRGQAYAHPKIADYPAAVDHFRQAATLMRSIGDDIGHARVVIDLSRALLHTHEAAVALVELEAVVDAVRAYGSTGYTAPLCTALGRVHADLGHIADAYRWFTEAVDLSTAAGHGATRQQAAVVALRDQLPPASDDPGQDQRT